MWVIAVYFKTENNYLFINSFRNVSDFSDLPKKYQRPPCFWGPTLRITEGFPGGAVVKNLPASAGDQGSCPGLGRSHMLWNS